MNVLANILDPYWAKTIVRVVAALAVAILVAGTLVYVYLFKAVSFMQSRLGPMEAGPQGSMQLLAEVGKFLQKEDIYPTKADRVLFKLAPYVVFMSTFLLVLVIPFGPARALSQLRTDALAIWQAAVDAVRSDRLVKENVRVDGDWLLVGDDTISLSKIGRIAVVGAGKAGAGMAAGLEEALGPRILAEKQVHGWINVPADCVPSPPCSTSPHASTSTPPVPPASTNRPKPASSVPNKILEIVSSLRPQRPLLLPNLRRRLGPLARARGRRFTGRKTGRHAPAECRRCEYRRAEHRPQATQPNQRRPPRQPLPRRPTDHANHLRRPRRPARRNRLRTDRSRFAHSARSPRDPGALRGGNESTSRHR